MKKLLYFLISSLFLLAVNVLHADAVPDIRGEYSGMYTTVVSNCTDSESNGTYNATLAMSISIQSGNTFSGSATGTFNIDGFTAIEYIQLSGTITESGQINGNTSHTFVDTGGEGTFTGQLSGNTLSIENSGHDTYGDMCTYKRSMSATREEGITPSANFRANPTIGNPPLRVNFSDESTGTITSWNWNFGDGASSAVQNPSHIYTDEGKHSVSLIVSGPYGSDTATKTDYISIAKITNGDINNDNVIDLKDALICLMIVSGDTSNAINLGGDVNGDGKVGLEEVLYILRTIINDGEPNQLLFAQFDQLSITSPEEISPLKCEGVIYDPWGYKLSEYTNMKLNTDSNSAPYSINLIPNGNPSTTESGIVSSTIVNKLLDVSAYNSVIISFWANSTSNPRINSIHNCDSGLNIRYRLDGGDWQHFCCYCGQHKTETSGWRYMDISGCPILTDNASTIEFAFEYYIQNSNGDSSVYYLIDDFKVTGVE